MIISGGQTGADRAALDFALENSISCSGWCPLGRKAEDGQIPEKYPLIEASSELYQHRTRLNVKDSDATIVILNSGKSRGTLLTIKCARQYQKPLIEISDGSVISLARLVEWLYKFEPQVLNVAGPRGSENSEVYKLTREILKKTICPSNENAPKWPPKKDITPDLINLKTD